MKATALKAACLAVGLATAWGSPANAQFDEIQLTISPSNNLTHVYFLYGTGTTSLEVDAVESLPDVAAGTTGTDTFFVAHAFGASYNLIGLYDQTNKLVTIGWSGAGSIIGSKDFGTEFPGFTESAIAAALLTNDTATIVNFFQSLIGYHSYNAIGVPETLVNFSIASDGGSMLAELIPEPSPMLLVSFGTLLILGFHRKRGRLMPLESKRIRDHGGC